MSAQLAQWIDEHKDEILDAYVVWRKERGEARPDKVMKQAIELPIVLLVKTLQGDAEISFVQGVEMATKNALASNTPTDVVAESLQGVFVAMRQVMDKERPPQWAEWVGVLGDIFLEGSQVVAKVLGRSFEWQKAGLESLYEISRDLNAADSADELLRVLARPAVKAGAFATSLLYIDLDEAGEPEWAETAAIWQREGEPVFPVGTRFYLPEFSFTQMWLSSPDAPQLIVDISTDGDFDDNFRQMMTGLGRRAVVIVPLLQAGRWVGLGIFSWNKIHEFDEEEVKVYQALTNLVSPAVENRRLVDNLERMVAERTRDMATFQALIENTPDAVGMTDMNGVMMYANPSFCKMLGYDDCEVIGASFVEAYVDDVDHFAEVLQQVLERGSWQGVLTYKRKDGSKIEGQLAALLLYDDDGEPRAVAGSIRDITERKQAEVERERMVSQLTRLTTVMNTTSDMVSMSDMQGNILYMNPAGMTLVGRENQDPTTMVIADYHSPKVGEKIGKEYIPVVMEKGAWSGETELLHADGTCIPVSQVITLIRDQDGEPEAMGTIIRDITEHKRAEVERERLQWEAMEAQKRAIQELSTPIIPVMDRILVMPLVGTVDSMRARDITRTLLAGIQKHRAKIVILDITGVDVVDSGVANHLNKTIHAARLKGAHTIITGVSDAVAETIVDLGIDWSAIETLNDLQTGLVFALNSLGIRLTR